MSGKKIMKTNKIFNPKGNDDVQKRTIIKWNSTWLFQLNESKYSWAKSLYPVMVWNFWIPEKVAGLQNDKIQFNESLSEGEQKAYKGILSFLIFLDSIQTVNLPNFNDYFTAPEVNLILSIQAYQEAIHSQSYSTILETVVDKKERDDIYYFWRTDKHLLERNEYIWKIYQDFLDNSSDKNFFKWIIWNFLLESIYFYNWFAFFDTLADQGKMVATDRMINYIRRDELCLHPDTELLTEKGWKTIEEINKNKNLKIAQVWLIDEKITFEKPLHYTWRNHKWKMLKIEKFTWKNRKNKIIQNILPEHDIVLKNLKNNKLSKIQANKANFHSYISLQQWGIVDWENTITNYQKFLIALQADWYIDKKRNWKITWNHTITFWLKKDRKKKRLEDLLDNLKKDWITYKKMNLKNKENSVKYIIKIPNNKYNSSKFFQDWVDITNFNTKTARAFLEELSFWDWREYKDWRKKYFNKSKKDIDIVQQILVLSNMKNTLTVKNSKNEHQNSSYVITYWPDKIEKHIDVQNIKKIEYDYNGKIGCVTMPEGTIITRYNWEICLTWNCHVSIFANIIKEIKKEFPEMYDEKTIYDMMNTAVEQEIKWSQHILWKNIIGMSNENVENYTKWLANERLAMLGLTPLYENVMENPYKHLDRLQDQNWEKWNFFESTVTNYAQSSAMNWSWEDF